MIAGERGRLVVEAALVALSARERLSWRQVARRLREGDPRLHAEYRLALAWAVHHVLRRDLPALEDVYVIGSSLEERARRASDLDLVLVCPPPDARGEALLHGLNGEISDAYREMVGDLPGSFRLLDLHVLAPLDESHPLRPALRGSNLPAYRLAEGDG